MAAVMGFVFLGKWALDVSTESAHPECAAITNVSCTRPLPSPSPTLFDLHPSPSFSLLPPQLHARTRARVHPCPLSPSCATLSAQPAWVAAAGARKTGPGTALRSVLPNQVSAAAWSSAGTVEVADFTGRCCFSFGGSRAAATMAMVTMVLATAAAPGDTCVRALVTAFTRSRAQAHEHGRVIRSRCTVVVCSRQFVYIYICV